MDELNRYIGEQSALASDGPGHFTTDPGRQRQLLAEFGLGDARLGLLKLAQSAVLSRTLELTFEPGPELKIRFEIKDPLPIPWWGAALAGNNERHSSIALALLALSQAYNVDWSWKSRGDACHGTVGQDDFTHLAGGAGPDNTFVCNLRPIKPRRWFHLRHWAVDLKSWLGPRLAWMPIPVKWNGKYLNRLLKGGNLVDGKEFDGVGKLSSSAEAFLYCSENEPGDLWLPSGSFAKYTNFRCTKSQRLGVDAEPAKAPVRADRKPVYRGFAVVAQHFNNWSETTFVRHGVTLDMQKDLLQCCAIAFVSAAGLDTDVTGLRLVRNAAFKERLELLRPEVVWVNRHDFRPTE